MGIQLPEHLQDRVATFPETHMGVHTVTITLRDGRVFTPVEIAWATELIGVPDGSNFPFAAADIDSIDDASGLS
jgi:hypothetical protein